MNIYYQYFDRDKNQKIKVVEGFEVQKGGSGYEQIRYLVDATQVLDFNHESVKESPCRQELFMLMKSGY